MSDKTLIVIDPEGILQQKDNTHELHLQSSFQLREGGITTSIARSEAFGYKTKTLASSVHFNREGERISEFEIL